MIDLHEVRRGVEITLFELENERGIWHTVEDSNTNELVNLVDTTSKVLSVIGEQGKASSTNGKIDEIIFNELDIRTERIGTVDTVVPDGRNPTTIKNKMGTEK